MKTNAPPRANSAARIGVVREEDRSNNSIASDPNPAQVKNQCVDLAHVGCIWKSPRDKRQAIQATIKSYNGSPPYLDLRIHEMNGAGRMIATSRGVTVSMTRLPQFAAMVGNALRKATALGLVGVSS